MPLLAVTKNLSLFTATSPLIDVLPLFAATLSLSVLTAKLPTAPSVLFNVVAPVTTSVPDSNALFFSVATPVTVRVPAIVVLPVAAAVRW